MCGEFDLIQRYFQQATGERSDVLLGIGDDCALLEAPPGQALAVSSDTLVSGRHFEAGIDPVALGHKALAVNLSDLAAMGAEPAWVSLMLSLPAADAAWLSGFMQGFAHLADEFGVQLIGGDTTRGPLNIGVTIQGLVDPAQALRRDAARVGDGIYVTGTLGDAGLALRIRQQRYSAAAGSAELDARLDRPWPRVAVGMRLRGWCQCAIDVSDGLAADLGHVCEHSGVGARIHTDRLPLSPPVRRYMQATGDWSLALSAGDDYELVFTIPAERQAAFERAAAEWDVSVTCIGRIETTGGVRALDPEGRPVQGVTQGYDHFRT